MLTNAFNTKFELLFGSLRNILWLCKKNHQNMKKINSINWLQSCITIIKVFQIINRAILIEAIIQKDQSLCVDLNDSEMDIFWVEWIGAGALEHAEVLIVFLHSLVYLQTEMGGNTVCRIRPCDCHTSFLSNPRLYSVKGIIWSHILHHNL